MVGANVLVIQGDEWMGSLLSHLLVAAGYNVEVVREARLGLDRARLSIPDCILCDAELPDIDGFWVARRLRSEPGAVGKIPFVFLTGEEDTAARLQGLEMGADVYITKPFRHEDVVAQVGALIGMAKRFRRQLDSVVEGPASGRLGPAAFRADLAQFSVSTVLTLLEMERRTGTLRVKSSGQEAQVELVDGSLYYSSLDGQPLAPVEVLGAALRWSVGRYSFEPKAERPTPDVEKHSITGILLDALRLEDEARRG